MKSNISIMFGLMLCGCASCNHLNEESGSHVKDAEKVVFDISHDIKIEFVKLKAGTFIMGAVDEKDLSGDAFPQRNISITRPFLIGAYEITRKQWQCVMGTTPWSSQDTVKEGDDCPANYISWNEAVEFCKKLSALMGRKISLPTEAQWEYACRGGSPTLYCCGDDNALLVQYAWFRNDDTANVKSHKVGEKKPNAWGIYDMHGNVAEWCADWYADTYEPNSTIDPSGPTTGRVKVIRGGDYRSPAEMCASASRCRNVPEAKSLETGFRVVCEWIPVGGNNSIRVESQPKTGVDEGTKK